MHIMTYGHIIVSKVIFYLFLKISDNYKEHTINLIKSSLFM